MAEFVLVSVLPHLAASEPANDSTPVEVAVMSGVTKLGRRVPPRPEAWHLRLGRKGEELAARHLVKIGFVILAKNWRCREGELDIVATDGQTLVVCEVKTRSGTRFGEPAEAVTADKMARVRRLTGQWLSTHRVGWCRIRFDVIAICVERDGEVRLRHIEGAF